VTTRPKRRAVVSKSLILEWAAVVAALLVCAVGVLLLWGAWYGTPVAAAFTRVGGASRVETALEASRFWLTPPRYVVETQTHASNIMLEAAQCAVAHDAPLLFTSPDPKQQRQVDATINDWRKIETPKGVAPPEVSTTKSQHDLAQAIDPMLPELIIIPKQIKECPLNRRPTDVARLSTLEVPSPLIRLRNVPPRQTLASVVVFAAAIEPGHPPDVAVGLALAAHMARANREQVSLVVVPHYLESDPGLEHKLQSQHELVTGGVVLGQTPTVPEDTRALLRQLLTSRDGHGVLAQLQENLGSVGLLIGALLALVGAAAATGVAAPMVIERLERTAPVNIPFMSAKDISVSIRKTFTGKGEGPATVKKSKSDWLVGLGENQEVTVRLRSGRKVSGTIEGQIPPDTRDATAFRIKKESSGPSGGGSSPGASSPGTEGKYVLVSVSEIEQIHFNDSKSEAAKASQTTA
jgi:hypothetical protein